MMLEQLIGKKIRVRILDRDNVGKEIPNRFTTIKGICTFAGKNQILDVYQVTIDRTPIFPIQFKDVEVIG
jgi:hypothetical protein